MKQITQRGLLLAIASLIVFVAPVHAQDATKELLAFTKKFQAAYNQKDDKAIKMMFTDNATRTSADGSVITGNTAIAANFATEFTDTPGVNKAGESRNRHR